MAESLTLAGFAECMAALTPFETGPVLAIGVSGGGDSMALLRLAAEWVRPQNGRVVALTVDHQLRAASAAEAQQVAGWCKNLGVEHHILNWAGDKPATAIQATARQARYNLLTNWCRQQQVLHLLTAHHQDDQAETVLLRFLKGSGPNGLAGMQHVVYRDHLRLLRPLLAVPKNHLLATCATYGQAFIHDPSNDNPRFTRVRLRQFLSEFADEASAGQLLHGNQQNHAMQNWVNALAQAGIAETVTYHPHHLLWDYQAWRAWPAPVQQQGLRFIIQAWQPQQTFIKQARLQYLADKLWHGAVAPKALTLGGLYFQPQRDNLIKIRHEKT